MPRPSSMPHHSGTPAHAAARSRSHFAGWIAAIVAVIIVVAGLGIWVVRQGSGRQTQQLAAQTDLSKQASVPKPVVSHHGNSPDCPDTDCIALLVNGDLLFHPHLWQNFTVDSATNTSNGADFNFDPLFEPMKRYIDASDISVCEFETPIAKRGGPYTGYPVFAIPPEVVDAAAKVGYTACTHATNHSWDQGTAGIARLWDELEAKGIAQTGSYKKEADSTEPMVINSPTGGGKLAVVTGTVSLNGMTADHDWQVDRLRESEDPHHRSDIDRAVAKAKAARKQGADVVAMAMHSVQEYLDYVDSWQQSEAHELADTGAFDVIYGAGCHCAQPIEKYHNTWIIYGLGNAVTVSAPAERIVNNQGATARIQFAGEKGDADSWRVNRIDWVPTANMRQGKYRWCPISSDKPDGVCWSDSQDAQVRQRIQKVLYSMGADSSVVKEWKITKE